MSHYSLDVKNIMKVNPKRLEAILFEEKIIFIALGIIIENKLSIRHNI